jgi:t-SNARE complex subunit (syntaxin)
VTRQDNDLDIIADLGLQAKQNVLNANEDLSEANETSKGSRKWYYALLLVAVFLVVGLIVVVYLSNGF